MQLVKTCCYSVKCYRDSYRVETHDREKKKDAIVDVKPTVNRRLPIGGMFAIPGELHPGNEVTQAEVFIRIAKANHVRAEERHRPVTNMYLPRPGPIFSVYLRTREDGPTCGY